MQVDWQCLLCVLRLSLLLLVVLQCDNVMANVSQVELRPDQVVVSLSIDSSSLEIQREALRLLTSIHLYGESLNQAHISICINHDVEDKSNVAEIERRTHFLVKQIHELGFEKLTISYSQSLPYPTFALSLNKMCAFNPQAFVPDRANAGADGQRKQEEVRYLLYLDADVFVATNPLPMLAPHLPLRRGGEEEGETSVLLCGRPFSTVHDAVDFSSFSGIPNNPFLDSPSYPLINTLNGGFAFYGMCNTGIYFMELTAAQQLAQMADEYLSRAATLTPEVTSNFLIDSFILWSAQQMLRFQVELFSLRLNYIVPAEDLYETYWLEEIAEAGLFTLLDVTDSNALMQHMPVSLFHFSRGSDIKFAVHGDGDGESCNVPLRSNSQRMTLAQSLVLTRMLNAQDTGALDCFIFFYMLEPFTDFVTRRDDEASSYFR